MSYVTQSLIQGERIVIQGKFHWSYSLTAWINVVVGVVVGAALIFPLVLTLIGLVMLVRKWTTEIAVTNRRLIYKRGWIARKTDEINLNRIEEINLKQGIGGRIFGYGTLVCFGTGSGDIEIPSIGSPLTFRKAIQEAQVRLDRN